MIVTGRSTQPRRWAASASAKAIAKPMTTASSVRITCSRSAGQSTSDQLSRTHDQQNAPFWRSQLDPAPKLGMTGWEAWARITRSPG